VGGKRTEHWGLLMVWDSKKRILPEGRRRCKKNNRACAGGRNRDSQRGGMGWAHKKKRDEMLGKLGSL